MSCKHSFFKNLIFIFFLAFSILSSCAEKEYSKSYTTSDLDLSLTKVQNQKDSLTTISKWLVKKIQFGSNDVNQKIIEEIEEDSWQESLNKIEAENLRLYQCNIFTSLYKKIVADYGFTCHELHMSNSSSKCGHAINVVKLNNGKYFPIDVWSQVELKKNTSKNETLYYFDLLKDVNAENFDSISIHSPNFKINLCSEKNQLEQHQIVEIIQSKNLSEIEDLLSKDAHVFFQDHIDNIDSTYIKNEQTCLEMNVNYSFIAENWLKECQEYSKKENRNFLSFYLDVEYIEISDNDSTFYLSVLNKLDKKYISNNF